MTRIEKLREKYGCIVRWGEYVESSDDFIDNEVLEAENDNAPITAIFRRDEWQIAEDIGTEGLRNRILGITV